MISVICPTFNEEKYIKCCIESILAQDYPKEDLEVIFVDGMSTDNTRLIINEYQSKYPFIKLIDNPQRIVPCAMNAGISCAQGQIIFRIDAHSLYQPDYFSSLSRRLLELDADNVGVVCKTDVLNKTPKTLAIKEVLSNRFGVGNSKFRIGISDVEEVDTVPFGCWKREVFDKYGLYDTRLIRNQDIELNKRIKRGGGKIYIVPDTYCTYLARETFSALAKNNYANGKWNILTVFYTNNIRSLSVRHFIPLLFVASLLIPPVLALFYAPFIYVSLLSLMLYLVAICGVCSGLVSKKKLNFFYLITAFATLHISYGWGSLIAMLKLPFIKR